MRNQYWNDLVSMVDGKKLNYQPVGFIVDSPWIPGWYGIPTIDYYSSDKLWFESNLKVVNTFPDVWFMPSFWSEFGMCTEPSAFGSRLIFLENTLPHAEKILADIADADRLPQPNVKTDGLLPFMVNRLKRNEDAIKKADHNIRFAVARGPLNIASFLMGTTEFMVALALDPDGSHRLLRKITGFICDWIAWQKECFPSIDGVLILDDIIGFVGEAEFSEFVVPYLRKIFSSSNLKVKFLHNDADGLITARNLKEMGVNTFNFSYNHSMDKIRELSGQGIILVGNIPPRDVMALGTQEQVTDAVKKAFGEIKDYDRIIWSVGGGMPPDVRSENIMSFISAVRNCAQLDLLKHSQSG
jgi:uroporphyrinogen-III decarboxylase